MDRTPNKRKSLAKANTTPNKVQKTAASPVSQKKNNKSPKFANKNQKTPQKQTNGKQNTPKGKKPKVVEEDDPELSDDSEEDDSNSSIEQAENTIETQEDSDDSEAEEDSDEDDGDDDDDKTEVKVKANKSKQIDQRFSIYVGGLNYNTTETELISHFSDCGSPLSAKILTIPGTLKSKGCAFVNLPNEAALQKALLKAGSELKSRNIIVKPKRNKYQYKRELLETLKKRVSNLEKELAEGGGKKVFNKNPKFVKKNFPNKKAVKQE